MKNQVQNQQKLSLEQRIMNNMASKIGSLEGNLSLMEERYRMLLEEYEELQKKHQELVEKSNDKSQEGE